MIYTQNFVPFIRNFQIIQRFVLKMSFKPIPNHYYQDGYNRSWDNDHPNSRIVFVTMMDKKMECVGKYASTDDWTRRNQIGLRKIAS
jgi:hypothetical protein